MDRCFDFQKDGLYFERRRIAFRALRMTRLENDWAEQFELRMAKFVDVPSILRSENCLMDSTSARVSADSSMSQKKIEHHEFATIG